MLQRKNILILADNDLKTSCLESPLRVVGHKVNCRKNLEEAINFCQLGNEIGQKIDLLIVDTEIGDPNWFGELPRKLTVENLLMVGDSSHCQEKYCISGKTACLCCPASLLAVVNELFYS